MAAQLRAARAGILQQVGEPRPGPWFAAAAMDAVAMAVGFDGYCLFGVDPVTGLRSVMFSREGLKTSTERLVYNETVEDDVNRYAELAKKERKAGVLATGGPFELKSPRLHEILRPEGYRSELRLVLVSGGRYWGALSLFRDDPRRPFTDGQADLMHELAGPLSLVLRRYQIGRPGSAPASRAAGVILFDGSGHLISVSTEARVWLASLADSWEHGATEDDVMRVAHEVARAATGRSHNPAVCRVRMPDGAWLVVSGSRVDTGDVQVAVVLRAGDVGSVAPAFALWCGLTPKESEILPFLVEGLPAKQMARRLSISIPTLNGHLRSIYRKADVRGRDELLSLVC